MHAIQHSLAHRAAPVTRTRVRWQPYNPTATQSTPSTTYVSFNTPSSSLSSSSSISSSSSSPISTPASDPEHNRPQPPVTPSPSEANSRDSQKTKYVMGLVDQAVKSLSDIWKPQDIPTVFLTSRTAAQTGGDAATATNSSTTTALPRHNNKHINTQLPSPESPNSRPSPPCPSSTATQSSPISPIDASQCNLVPIKGFVHEVLRRSRTSGGILQTALCYVEAIRPKIPELVRREKAGEGSREEPELASRITLLDDSAPPSIVVDEVANLFQSHLPAGVQDIPVSTDGAALAQQSEVGLQLALDTAAAAAFMKKTKTPTTPLSPLPPLPSPLLCPRRTFLAALILASKFTQDRCYSNRAWAKLSGLPPREIGRCERALGDALEWRLWVGKAPVSPPSADRPVTRCKSDGDLLSEHRQRPAANPSWKQTAPANTATFLAPIAPINVTVPQLAMPPMIRQQSGLRRCATFLVGSVPPPTTFGLGPAMPLTMQSMAAHNLYVPQRLQCASDMIGSTGPPTPTLSDSPSSTDSSSSEGERTVLLPPYLSDSFSAGACSATSLDGGHFGRKFGGHTAPTVVRPETYAPFYPFASFGIGGGFASNVVQVDSGASGRE